MSRRRWAWSLALVAAGLLLGLILLLPLRLALAGLSLDDHALAARSVSGTVWSGRIEELRLGRLSVGSVNTKLSSMPLLLGRAELSMAAVGDEGGSGPVGTLVVGRNLIGADMAGDVALGDLLGTIPVASVDLEGVKVRFVDGACAEAEGRVRARLAGAVALLGFAQGLEGPLHCAGPSLTAHLSSQSGQARLMLKIDGHARYQADLTVAEPDDTLTPLLVGNGFTRVPGGYRLRVSGTLG